MARRRPYGVRLTVEGEDKFRRDLRGVGRAGDESMDRIRRSTARANRGLRVFNAAASETKRELTAIGAARGFGGLGRILGPAGLLGAVGAAGLAALVVQARSAADAIASIGDAADRAQVDVDLYEKFSAALTQIGQPVDNLETSFRTFSKRIGEIRGEITAGSKAFQALGVSLDDVNDQAKSNEQIIFDLADAFQRLEDPTIKAAAGQDLFGRSGGAMVEVMERGSDGVRELFDEVEALGLLYGGDVIRNAQAINAEFGAQARIIDVQLKKAFLDAAPAVRDLTEQFIELLPKIIEATQSFLAFIGLMDRPIRIQLETVTGEFENANRRRADLFQQLERRGLDPLAPDFEDRVEGAGIVVRDLAEKYRNAATATDNLLERTITLRKQLELLNRPAAQVDPEGTGGLGGGGGGGGGAGRASAFKRAAEAAQKQIEALRVENETHGLSAEAIALHKFELDLLTAAQEEFGALTPETAAEIDRLTEAFARGTEEKIRNRRATEALKEEEREAARAQQQRISEVRETTRTIVEELDKVRTGAQSVEEAIFQIIKAILELKSVSGALDNFFGNLFNSGGGQGGGGGLDIGGLFLANIGALFRPSAAPAAAPLPVPRPARLGEAFERGGRIHAFRDGGIVRERSLFGFAGGVGEMAEDAAEGIFPLLRNSRGQLGVSAVGAAAPPQVNVYTRDPDTRVVFGRPSRAQVAGRVRRFQSRAVE